MSVCLKCKKQLEDDIKYCSECGTKVPQAASCPHCNKKVNLGFVFCPYCGANIKTDALNDEHKKSFLNTDKKILKMGSSVVAVILVIVTAVSLIVNSVSKENYLFYLKDEELFSANLENQKKWQITEAFNESAEFDNQQMLDYASNISKHVKMSKDKNTIFYMDQLESVNRFSLYYRKVNSNKEPEKIAKDVTTFQISDNGDCVSYLRENSSLYWYDLKTAKNLQIM